MNRVEGMLEDFKQARIVYLTTFSEDGKKRRRPMTNFNEDPYEMMWFPTDRNTKKVENIEKNKKVLITFPSSREDEFYEIQGRAEFEDDRITAEKWKWWYLYWHPAQRRRFTEPFPHSRSRPDRMIINVYPESARIVQRS